MSERQVMERITENSRADLERYLAASDLAVRGPIQLTEFGAGASNPTYRLDHSTGSYVLRTRPLGALTKGAHAIDREWKALTALSTVDFPSPSPVVYCADPTVLGTDFYLMEYIPGRKFDDYSLPGLSAPERAAIYDSMNETIARLHTLDPLERGLGSWGKRGTVYERQISFWVRQYESLDVDYPLFPDLARRIAERAPKHERRSIIHGDVTFLNMIVSPTEPLIEGLLDWELATVGDPLADLCYNLLPWYLPSSPTVGYWTLQGHDIAELGLPTMESYIDRYSARTGFEYTESDIRFGIAYNSFRMAGIAMGAYERARKGTAKNSRALNVGANIDRSLDRADGYLRGVLALGEQS